MLREVKPDTMKASKVIRVHPESQQQNYHSGRKHNVARRSIPESVEYVDEYASDSAASIDADSVITDESSIRSVSPPMEIVQMPQPLKTSSRFSIHPTNGSSSILTIKPVSLAPSSLRSYIVSPGSSFYRKVSWAPSKISPVEDKGTQKSSETIVKPNNILFAAVAIGLAIAASIIIVLAVLLAIKNNGPVFSSNSFVLSSCSVNCMMSITPFLASTIASWPLDSSLSDLNNVYPASYSNPPTVNYATGNMGEAVSFTGSEFLTVSTQFMNLSYRSWTIEGWLLLTDLSGNRGIFSQCQSTTTTDQCLTLSLQSGRLHLGFGNNDLDGTTVLQTSSITWRHVAFVYDYNFMQQSIYIDGVLEATTGASGIAVGPYKGSTGNVLIGRTTSGDFFNGRIDHLQVSGSAKTACQILNDATLTAYYAFDIGASYLDSSMNVFHGTSNLLITVPGHVNYAYSFQYEYSYFQSQAFTAYQSDEPFSVALWVKPFVVTGGTLIHLSTNIDGSSSACFDLLGFSSSGQLVGQLYSGYDCCICCTPPNTGTCPCRSTTNVPGPTMLVNTWTHIVLTYSINNGLALYTNGTLRGVSSGFSSFPSSSPDYMVRPYMTVGNVKTTTTVPSCLIGNPSLSPASYRGLIDELRLYSRELTKTEICSLFHT